jgi:hypothetical protein
VLPGQIIRALCRPNYPAAPDYPSPIIGNNSVLDFLGKESLSIAIRDLSKWADFLAGLLTRLLINGQIFQHARLSAPTRAG